MNWNIKHTYKARKYKTNDFVNINLILLAFELINSFFMESIALSDFILFIEIYLYTVIGSSTYSSHHTKNYILLFSF